MQRALQSRPADPEVLALRERIVAARSAAERVEQAMDVQEQLARVVNLEKAGRREAAIAVIDEALLRFPDSVELATARTRIQRSLQTVQPEESPYGRRIAAARRALEEHRFGDAAEEARLALELKPGDKAVLALLERIEVERERARRNPKPLSPTRLGK